MGTVEESRSMSVNVPVATAEQALFAGTQLPIMATLGRRQTGAAAQDAKGVQATADDIDLCLVGSQHRIYYTSNLLLLMSRASRPLGWVGFQRIAADRERIPPPGRSRGSSRCQSPRPCVHNMAPWAAQTCSSRRWRLPT